MDEGPFRVPRSSDRRPARRSEPAHQQPEEEPEPVHEEPKPVRHVPTSHHVVEEEKNPIKRLLLPIVAVLVVIIVVVGWFVWSSIHGGVATAIDTKGYQALFLTNGQVYFGKLQAAGDNYFKMTDIYYLQSNQAQTDSKTNPQQTNTDQNANVQLIKLGNEIHGPQDQMVVNREQVLFFENLKSDGKVSQSIQSYQKSHK